MNESWRYKAKPYNSWDGLEVCVEAKKNNNNKYVISNGLCIVMRSLC